ncbi:MAG: carboxypeptidase regulatory-like domain-containing protein, partial [Candidatus Hydrogenedentes bacterium]|nr:carboxypeptidase regulatory-like domain-containing protein [Candidatus Hydrogenedentota bacterium]
MRACKCCLLSLFLAGFAAQALDGTVTTTEAKPIENAYIGLLDANFAPITSGSTDAAGKFSVAGAGGKYLVIQPAPTAGDGGVQVHPYQPRLYVLGENEQSLALKLSPADSVILEAYDLEG